MRRWKIWKVPELGAGNGVTGPDTTPPEEAGLRGVPWCMAAEVEVVSIEELKGRDDLIEAQQTDVDNATARAAWEAGRAREFEARLAECYRLTGSDPDGDSDAMLATHAVDAVRELREENERVGEWEGRAVAAEQKLAGAEDLAASMRRYRDMAASNAESQRRRAWRAAARLRDLRRAVEVEAKSAELCGASMRHHPKYRIAGAALVASAKRLRTILDASGGRS